MAKYSIGRVMPITKGEWNTEDTYNIGDIVSYKESTFWARKDGLKAIFPSKHTDDNYQHIATSAKDTGFFDEEMFSTIHFVNSNPKEDDLIKKIVSNTFSVETMEELNHLAQKDYCFTIIINKDFKHYDLKEGETITFVSKNIVVDESKEPFAKLITSTKTFFWYPTQSSGGQKILQKEVSYYLKNSKREEEIVMRFDSKGKVDFGNGIKEDCVKAINYSYLPKSDIVVILPKAGHEELFKKAQIVVSENQFTESYGRVQLKLELAARNLEMYKCDIGLKVVVL